MCALTLNGVVQLCYNYFHKRIKTVISTFQFDIFDKLIFIIYNINIDYCLIVINYCSNFKLYFIFIFQAIKVGPYSLLIKPIGKLTFLCWFFTLIIISIYKLWSDAKEFLHLILFQLYLWKKLFNLKCSVKISQLK